MRFFAPLIVAFASLVAAQTSTTKQNAISIPSGGLQISAGENTIKWTNPTSGTVTIKLQQGAYSTPNSGYVLASNVPASAETATFNIPADIVNSFDYYFEIVDEQDTSTVNYSTPFAISGGTGTGLPSSSTAAASSASMASTASASLTSSTSASSASSSSASSSSASAASSSSSSASSSSSSGASSTSSAAASSSSSETVPTSVTGGASLLGVNGGIAALVAGAVLVL